LLIHKILPSSDFFSGNLYRRITSYKYIYGYYGTIKYILTVGFNCPEPSFCITVCNVNLMFIFKGKVFIKRLILEKKKIMYVCTVASIKS
jgi:hypothetical protein